MFLLQVSGLLWTASASFRAFARLTARVSCVKPSPPSPPSVYVCEEADISTYDTDEPSFINAELKENPHVSSGSEAIKSRHLPRAAALHGYRSSQSSTSGAPAVISNSPQYVLLANDGLRGPKYKRTIPPSTIDGDHELTRFPQRRDESLGRAVTLATVTFHLAAHAFWPIEAHVLNGRERDVSSS